MATPTFDEFLVKGCNLSPDENEQLGLEDCCSLGQLIKCSSLFNTLTFTPS